MRCVERVLGWIALAIAAGLILLGIQSWPPGGLMFALPFVFLIPGLVLGFIGGVLLWHGSRPSVRVPSEPDGQ
jgi:hypothetical protein